jgi:hypothetical protein
MKDTRNKCFSSTQLEESLATSIRPGRKVSERHALLCFAFERGCFLEPTDSLRVDWPGPSFLYSHHRDGSVLRLSRRSSRHQQLPSSRAGHAGSNAKGQRGAYCGDRAPEHGVRLNSPPTLNRHIDLKVAFGGLNKRTMNHPCAHVIFTLTPFVFTRISRALGKRTLADPNPDPDEIRARLVSGHQRDSRQICPSSPGPAAHAREVAGQRGTPPLSTVLTRIPHTAPQRLGDQPGGEQAETIFLGSSRLHCSACAAVLSSLFLT